MRVGKVEEGGVEIKKNLIEKEEILLWWLP